jgi:hypothetical protein
MSFVRSLLPAQEDISEYEQPLTHQDVATIQQDFEILASRNFRLPFVKFRVNSGTLWRVDRWILESFPPLRHFATSRVAALRK